MTCTIEQLNPASPELPLVAARMRDTLIEVLGEEVGGSMYDLPWVLDRATSHLDGRLPGAIFVAHQGPQGPSVGHIIVRQEHDEHGDYGLVSTAYVLPEVRRQGVAAALLAAAHGWFADRGLQRTATDTAQTNHPLIALYARHGYEVVVRWEAEQMVRLGRNWQPADGSQATIAGRSASA